MNGLIFNENLQFLGATMPNFFLCFDLFFFKRIPGFGFGHSYNVYKLKLGARRSPECSIFHHLPQSFWGPSADTRPPAVTKRKAKDLFENAAKKARLEHMASASKKKPGKQ